MNNEDLVKENLRLVHACCHKMCDKGIEYDDLYSAGCIGLVKAAKRFDESKGFKFSTYAVPVILGEIKDLFRENNPVKISRSLKELSLKVKRESDILKSKLGREPTVAEIAKNLKVSAEEITEAVSASVAVKSLDSDDFYNQPSVSTEEKTLNKIAIFQALEKLEPQDKALINLRFFQDKTQSDTAKALGLTQVQVSRKEKIALKELKNQLIF